MAQSKIFGGLHGQSGSAVAAARERNVGKSFRALGVRTKASSRRRAKALNDSRARLWSGPSRLEALIYRASLCEEDQSAWCRENRMYNDENRHSCVHFVIPAVRHSTADCAVLAARSSVYTHAKTRCPSRWNGRATRN